MLKFKHLKNVKLTTCIIYIVLIGFISISSIGWLGFKYIQKINNNIDEMYNSDLAAIEKENEMSNTFQSIRLEITKQLKNYSEQSNSKIQLLKENLSDNLKEYSNNNLNQVQKNNIDKIINCLNNYMCLWDEVNTLLVNNQLVSESKEQQIYAQGDITTDSFSKLIYEDNLNAQIRHAQSQQIYEESLTTFIYIVSLSVLALITISTLIIINVRKSSKEIIDVLNLISQGNISINLDTDSNNEFGIMKKPLAKA